MTRLVISLCLVAVLVGTCSAIFQRCYSCKKSSTHAECNKKSSIVPCIGGCQTKEEVKGKGFSVEKKCVRFRDCKVSCDKKFKKCYDCCWGDLCNKRGGWLIPRPPRWHPCDDDPCKNGGTCVKKRRRYTCSCRPGFSGKNCELGGDTSVNLLGCFKDDRKNRAFDLGPWTDVKMTVPICLKYCRSKQYEFAGLQNGEECWCGKGPGYKKHGELNRDRCAMFCKGDPKKQHRCGSGWVNSVYKL